MRILAALGGNALLRRGENAEAVVQLRNLSATVPALAGESAADARRAVPARRDRGRDPRHDRVLARARTGRRATRPLLLAADRAVAGPPRPRGVAGDPAAGRGRFVISSGGRAAIGALPAAAALVAGTAGTQITNGGAS